ncbi:hypothetical protein ABH905_001477 [Pseudomonas frederiksbergensis]
MKLMRIGVDLAKNVFQIHGVDRHEQPVWRQRLLRDRWLQTVLEKIEPGCKSAWKVVAVHTIGHGSYRHADLG